MIRLYNEYYAPHSEFRDILSQVDAHIMQALRILADTGIDPIDAEHYITGTIGCVCAQFRLQHGVNLRREVLNQERGIKKEAKAKPVEELEDGAPGTSDYNSFSVRS